MQSANGLASFMPRTDDHERQLDKVKQILYCSVLHPALPFHLATCWFAGCEVESVMIGYPSIWMLQTIATRPPQAIGSSL